MKRRGFMKMLALTPFAGLLKPTERIVLQGDSPPPQKVKWSNIQPPTPFSYGPVFITQVAPVKN